MVSFYIVLRYRFEIRYFGFTSRQNSQKRWYNESIPLLGGLAIFVSLFISDLLCTQEINIYLWAIVPLLFLGVINDQMDLSVPAKLAFQLVALAIWFMNISADQLLPNHFGLSISGTYFTSTLWLLAVINAFNMIDSMDGLASGVGILISIFLLVLPGQLAHPYLVLSLAGALCGFIYWNLRPAKIYLGATGAPLIGFVIGTELLTWMPPNFDEVQILVPLFLLAYPGIDLLLALLQRWKMDGKLFSGGMNQIYHRLGRAGMSIQKIWIILMIIVATLGSFAVLISSHKNPNQQFFIALLVVGLFSYLLYSSYQLESQRKDYFDDFLKLNICDHLNALDIVEVSAEDCMVVYSFSNFRDELLRMTDDEWQKWLFEAVQFIKMEHSLKSLIFMSSDGDLLVLDTKINGALKFHNFHQKFHDSMSAKSPTYLYWPLLLLKYMPIIEVGRLPGNIEVTVTEESSADVA
jgi:UDP-GlcNAc:undecaprenyl-phosphate GlcNAc-1-phosphate transferase